MVDTPGVPDHAVPVVKTVGWSPKALFATAAAVVVPLLLQGLVALIEAVAANPALFDGLPAPLQHIVATIITGAAVLAAAWKASPGNVTVGRS